MKPLNFPVSILSILIFAVFGETIGDLTECGQTFYGTSGVIEYKLNQTYDANELCAFVIRAQNYSHISYHLESHGINEADPDAISIMGWSVVWRRFESVHMGPPNTTVDVVVAGSEAVVVFKTKTNLGKGFRLRFEVVDTCELGGPGNDFVFNNQTASNITVPYGSTYNGTGEITINFLVITHGAKMITDENSVLRLNISENFGWQTPVCSGYFEVWSFIGDGATWEGKVCHEDLDKTVYETKGLFIVFYVHFPYGLVDDNYGSMSWEKVSIEQDSK